MHVRAYVDPGDPENAFLLAAPGAGDFMLVVVEATMPSFAEPGMPRLPPFAPPSVIA